MFLFSIKLVDMFSSCLFVFLSLNSTFFSSNIHLCARKKQKLSSKERESEKVEFKRKDWNPYMFQE